MRLNLADAGKSHVRPPALEDWHESPTLSKKQAQGYGLLVSCLGMVLVSLLLHGAIVPSGILSTVLILALALPLHELVHALSTPGWGLTARTVIGVQKGKGCHALCALRRRTTYGRLLPV